MASSNQGKSSGPGQQNGQMIQITGSSGMSWGDISQVITPDNVAMVVSLITAAAGITTAAVKGIQLWVEERKARKIRIRYKELEIEISGVMTEEDILQRLRVFEVMQQRLTESEVEITLLDGSMVDKSKNL
ncbi:MAG TPA: hypothetical protein VFR03_15395 [Thermoanaerobaculia bacterium]|nr:hypothetical protein [Thermoanaerobaculia bacterium]